MRRLLGMACLGLTPLVVVLFPGSTLVPVRSAAAGPEAPVGAPTPGSLTRYQARLESEATQVFDSTVTDPLRRPLSNKGVALWATSSVTDWSRIVTEAAPSLASVVDSALDLFAGGVLWLTAVLARRTEHRNFPTGKHKFEPIGTLVSTA